MSPNPVADLNPAPLDIEGVRAGDKNEMPITLKIAGVPIDLTGMTISASARAKKTDEGTAPIIAVITVVDAPNGKINVRWPGDQVRTVLAGKALWNGVWDLQQVTGSEDPVTLLEGGFQAVQDVTR